VYTLSILVTNSASTPIALVTLSYPAAVTVPAESVVPPLAIIVGYRCDS
jgi:hypothetical protein